LGVEPTGRVVSMRGTELARVADGRIASIYAIFDLAGVLQQLGVVPGPAPVVAAAPAPVAGSPPAGSETGERLLGRLIDEFWNGRNFDVLAELVHPRATCPSAPELPPGPDGFRQIA